MTIPNLLTILRVLLTPLLVIFLLENRLIEALIVFAVAGITDALDGLIARLYKQKTRLGAFLDPLADKLLLATTYVLLAFQNLVPSWLTVIVLSRDVLIVLGVFVLFMQDLPFEIRPSLASKLTTCAQIVTAITAMATALASLLSERPVKPFLAMTGEITLRGDVLPIGGLKEKLLAAYRSGIKTVILPKQNKKDMTEIPPEIKKGVKFRFVSNVAEVLKYAFDLTSITGGRGSFQMEHARYEEIPPHLAEKVIAATKEQKEEEK